MTGHFPAQMDRLTMFIFQLDQMFFCFLLTCCYGELAHACSGGSVPLEAELDSVRVLDQPALHGHCETTCSQLKKKQ